MNSRFVTLALVATFSTLSGGALVAQEKKYSFKDPKGVNSVTFVLDSEIEPILGVASGISGTVSFDPKKPKNLKGQIIVDASTIHVLNDRMKSKMQTGEWLDVANHPEVKFDVKKVKSAKKHPKKKDTMVVQLVGDFTLKGVEKEVMVTAEITHLAGQLGKRFPRQEGDLMVLRATFNVQRSDYKVGNAMPTVADVVEIRLAIAGGAGGAGKKKEGGW